jgi:hypothetical protein
MKRSHTSGGTDIPKPIKLNGDILRSPKTLRQHSVGFILSSRIAHSGSMLSACILINIERNAAGT